MTSRRLPAGLDFCRQAGIMRAPPFGLIEDSSMCQHPHPHDEHCHDEHLHDEHCHDEHGEPVHDEHCSSGHCGAGQGAEGRSRAEFHREHQQHAEQLAARLLARKAELGPRWLAWVAGELYQLSPAPLAAMVRRELTRLSEQAG